MKKLFVIFISMLFILPVFSQDRDNNGGDFLKRIEYNRIVFANAYNFKSKGDLEKRFFGDFNAPFEFCYEPSFAKYGIYGFRLFMDSLKNTYMLEIKFLMNLEAIQKNIQDKYPVRTVSSSEMASMPKDSLDLISKQNTANIQKAIIEAQRQFSTDIDSRSFPISNQFAEILYKKAVSLIDNFKANGICPLIDDGYVVTFRTVVDDEVWSLKIHCPAGDALKMSNLCKQITMETLATGKLDESRYIKMLDDFN